VGARRLPIGSAAVLRHVTTPDGVRIACEVSGQGTPLVMVHGAGSGRWSFDLVRPHLEDAFEVWAIDRRGRGDSTDGDEYGLERELYDVGAVLREAGEDALLFGHSFGGLLCAGASAGFGVAGEGRPARLALYEGPMGGVLASEDWIDRFEANLEAGNPDQAMRDFMSDVGGYTDAEIDAMQGTPYWQARVAAAPTVPRELRAEHAVTIGDLLLEKVAAPTLLLVGGRSPGWAKQSTDAYAAVIPQMEVITMDGQGHGAAFSAPAMLASELQAFLAQP
jgi:pimeloyl-ACP methyl ester carboxylesterase